MHIHEYQAKELFREAGIAVPEGWLLTAAASFDRLADQLDYPVAVKAQVHAGGRGKGGGVRLVTDAAAGRNAVAAMLGMTLVTPQTGLQGEKVHALLVEECVRIDRELYCCLTIDREAAAVTLLVSGAGGMDIEQVAATAPDRLARVRINPLLGLKDYHLQQALSVLDLDIEQAKQFRRLLAACYGLFMDRDCNLLEINPLVVTADGRLIALDAKMGFDDNALYRQPAVAAMRDAAAEDPLEARAAKVGLNYISLDGNIGNMVNGAGLAMATMDIIKQAGAAPANFLDVGGGASSEMVEEGLRIILADPKVRAVLINIFGGILRCDVLARGVVEAAGKVDLAVPVVVRMEGTNVEQGRRILADSGLNLVAARDLAHAAELIGSLLDTTDS